MVTEAGKRVQEFYNKTPFPDYDLERFKTKEDLRIAAYPFAEILDRSIPEDASIIDVGTGTGQLSAFLSLRRKCVWGIDFSDGSLSKARKLKEQLKLKSWTLKKVDLLDPQQIDAIGRKFDYVICMGVLHHTGHTRKGFENILRLLKPGGHIGVGLYNTYGRIPLKIRKFLAKTVFKNNNRVKDWFIRMQIGDIEDKERARGWWSDQYLHPYESSHSVGEVLKWFKSNNIQFHQTVPSTTFFDDTILETAGVWNTTGQKYPSFSARVWKQLAWIWQTHKEGGYWITFGKKEKPGGLSLL